MSYTINTSEANTEARFKIFQIHIIIGRRFMVSEISNIVYISKIFTIFQYCHYRAYILSNKLVDTIFVIYIDTDQYLKPCFEEILIQHINMSTVQTQNKFITNSWMSKNKIKELDLIGMWTLGLIDTFQSKHHIQYKRKESALHNSLDISKSRGSHWHTLTLYCKVMAYDARWKINQNSMVEIQG